MPTVRADPISLSEITPPLDDADDSSASEPAFVADDEEKGVVSRRSEPDVIIAFLSDGRAEGVEGGAPRGG